VRIASRAYASQCLHSMGPEHALLRHTEPRGGVHDARSARLHRGALRSWREHSTGHACPASHALRTSRPSMRVAGIAGTLVFVVPLGALLELCRSRGALSPTKWFPTRGRRALTLPLKTRHSLCEKPCRIVEAYENQFSGVFRTCSWTTQPLLSLRSKSILALCAVSHDATMLRGSSAAIA